MRVRAIKVICISQLTSQHDNNFLTELTFIAQLASSKMYLVSTSRHRGKVTKKAWRPVAAFVTLQMHAFDRMY